MNKEQRRNRGWELVWGVRNFEGAWLLNRTHGDSVFAHETHGRRFWASQVGGAYEESMRLTTRCFPARYWRRAGGGRIAIGGATMLTAPEAWKWVYDRVTNEMGRQPSSRRFCIKLWEIRKDETND